MESRWCRGLPISLPRIKVVGVRRIARRGIRCPRPSLMDESWGRFGAAHSAQGFATIGTLRHGRGKV